MRQRQYASSSSKHFLESGGIDPDSQFIIKHVAGKREGMWIRNTDGWTTFRLRKAHCQPEPMFEQVCFSRLGSVLPVPEIAAAASARQDVVSLYLTDRFIHLSAWRCIRMNNVCVNALG